MISRKFERRFKSDDEWNLNRLKCFDRSNFPLISQVTRPSQFSRGSPIWQETWFVGR
jgi:hypothetical protein